MQKCLFLTISSLFFFIWNHKEWASLFRRESENEKKNNLIKPKHGYLIHTWSDKAFKSSVVNLALSSLHKRSLEITFTVPLISWFSIYTVPLIPWFSIYTVPLIAWFSIYTVPLIPWFRYLYSPFNFLV